MKFLLEAGDPSAGASCDQITELLEQMTAAVPDGTLSITGGGYHLACRLPAEHELGVTRVPAAIRRDQRFRTGYNLGYRHGSSEARMQTEPAPASAQPEPAAVEARIQDVTHITATHAVTVVPCCGRSITLRRPPGDDTAIPAVCCACKTLYSAVLAQEEPDGFDDQRQWIARFTMTDSGLPISKHRAGRWEPPAKTAAGSLLRNMQAGQASGG
jgi:hypothetical protein